MNTFSNIVGGLIIFLIVIAIITVIRYPKQILIDAPAAFLKLSFDRFLSYIVLITSPVWGPVWFLDQQFKWGLFDWPFFKFFYDSDSKEPNRTQVPDLEYPVKTKKEIDFVQFSKFFISSLQDSNRVVKSLTENLNNIGKSLEQYKVMRVGGRTVVQVMQIDLYDFNLLIQCLDNDFKRSKNFGFANCSEFSFFGMTDRNTLNNIIGQTSTGERFAFNLVNGQMDYLSINDEIEIKTKYSTAFFKDLVDKT